MGKRRAWRKMTECFLPSMKRCLRGWEGDEGMEKRGLLTSRARMMNVLDGKKMLVFGLQHNVATIVLRVSMHCHGCAKKVRKQLAKMEGVTSFDVDLENKRVVVVGNITPLEVLVNISKVKTAQLLSSSLDQPSNCMLLPWAPPCAK